jgi:hypothetical protein
MFGAEQRAPPPTRPVVSFIRNVVAKLKCAQTTPVESVRAFAVGSSIGRPYALCPNHRPVIERVAKMLSRMLHVE